MTRHALIAALLLGAATIPASAQPGPPRELQCVPARMLEIVAFGREQMPGGEGGRVAYRVQLRNPGNVLRSFTLSFTAPNARNASLNQANSLNAHAQVGFFLGTLPGGTQMSDENLRRYTSLRCPI